MASIELYEGGFWMLPKNILSMSLLSKGSWVSVITDSYGGGCVNALVKSYVSAIVKTFASHCRKTSTGINPDINIGPWQLQHMVVFWCSQQDMCPCLPHGHAMTVRGIVHPSGSGRSSMDSLIMLLVNTLGGDAFKLLLQNKHWSRFTLYELLTIVCCRTAFRRLMQFQLFCREAFRWACRARTTSWLTCWVWATLFSLRHMRTTVHVNSRMDNRPDVAHRQYIVKLDSTLSASNPAAKDPRAKMMLAVTQ